MPSTNPARILFCSASQAPVQNERALFDQAGYVVSWLDLDRAGALETLTYDLIVLESAGRELEAVHFCQRLRSRRASAFVPILFLTAAHDQRGRLAGLDAGADAALSPPLAPGELLAQARALLRLKESHDRLSERAAEFHRVNKRLHQAYQQIDEELQLARRIQQSLLPQTMPEMPPAHFAVHYRPCGRVGGDFYDVFRLDENHAGFYVADVMGHGIPAALVTIFLKKALRSKEIQEHRYRLLPPDEVLLRLNREMIEQALAENPFITMVYALLNHQEGTLSFSRAGHPHPLYVPCRGAPELWQVHGTLLGVFDTHYIVQTQQLRAGDRVLLYTDGVDADPKEEQSTSSERLLESAQKHRELPLADFIAQIAQEMVGHATPADDLTILGLELRA
jgi:sigma-B regulation protein RsbU (phosphoserine phosphatase)